MSVPEIIDFNAIRLEVTSNLKGANYPVWMGFFYHEDKREVMSEDVPSEFKEGMAGLTKQGIVWEKFVRHHSVNGQPYEVIFHSGARPCERDGSSYFRPDVLGMALLTTCARYYIFIYPF